MTDPRTVCQHTTHGADRTLTFEDGIEAASKYHDDKAKKLRHGMKRFSNEDYPCVASEDAAAHEAYATAIRALSHKEQSK